MDPVYWSILLVIGGFLVIIVELFIPSAGLLGLLAAALLISGVVVAFFHSVGFGAMMLFITTLLLPVFIMLMLKVWPHTPIGRAILVEPPKTEDVIPQGEEYEQIRALVGRLGVARTKMLPSGTILIDDQKFDAVSEGLPIEKGQAIKVVKVTGNRIVVRPYSGSIEDEKNLPVRDNNVLSQPIEELGIEGLDDLSDLS